jgi:hypothetical protein
VQGDACRGGFDICSSVDTQCELQVLVECWFEVSHEAEAAPELSFQRGPANCLLGLK